MDSEQGHGKETYICAHRVGYLCTGEFEGLGWFRDRIMRARDPRPAVYRVARMEL
jgi:hypothetical protein